MPIQLFAIIMGLSGFAVVFAKSYHFLDTPYWIYLFILFIDTVLFFTIFISYMFKILFYTEFVKKEFYHPIKSSFMAAISISFLLISIAYYDFAPSISILFWYIGTPLQFVFTLIVLRYWIYNNLEIVHSNPAWFIPIVGNVLVPVVGVEAAPIYVSIFFFSLGMFFWIVLFTIIMYRIIFHHQLAKKLLPTLFIFIAPPAVGFISYLRITNASIDMVSLFLYFIAIVTLLLLFFMFKIFDKKEFFISWWAYTFPMAAITIATLMMHMVYRNSITMLLSYILIAITTSLIGFVVLKTIKAVKDKKICIMEIEK
jgi:tellurite resistance protein